MSPKRRAELAAAGVLHPFSTLATPSVGIQRPTPKPKPRRVDAGPDKATVKIVWERDGGCCVRCGLGLSRADRGDRWSVHHRRLRSAGGDNSLSNLIVLCGHGTAGCHGLVHSRPGRYRREGGWILRSTDDPAAYPVLHSRLGLVFLAADGGSSRTRVGAA
jgi:hypothetical protein